MSATNRPTPDGGQPGRLRDLTLHLAAFVLDEVLKGRAVDVAMHAFGRHRTKLMGGLLGGAGAAGGAWAAVSAWASSLGIWGSLGLSLGLLAPPAWIPVAGGLAGLSATGGALAGALSVSRARARRRHLQSIVGLSRFLVGPAGPTAQDERLLRGFLRSRGSRRTGPASCWPRRPTRRVWRRAP